MRAFGLNATLSGNKDMADIFGNRKKSAGDTADSGNSSGTDGAASSSGLPATVGGRSALSSPQNQQRKGPPVLAGKKPNSPLRPDIPRRGADGSMRSGDQSRQLVVGRDIALAGEIKDCERLVVEGSVEAALIGSELLNVTETGIFRGPADVHDAEISGTFSGELTVQNRLVVTGTGRVDGRIRYRELEIQPGGQISGQVELLSGHNV